MKIITGDKVSPLKSVRTTWIAEIPANTAVEDILKPEYWADVANRVRRRDHIEADWIDGTRLVVLRILGVGSDFVKVQKMAEYEFAATAKSGIDNFEVKWIAPGTHKFGIIRKSNKEYVETGFDSSNDADDWLKQNLANIAA